MLNLLTIVYLCLPMKTKPFCEPLTEIKVSWNFRPDSIYLYVICNAVGINWKSLPKTYLLAQRKDDGDFRISEHHIFFNLL